MPAIGPSEDAFREHGMAKVRQLINCLCTQFSEVTNERRRKRNPNRVGANFAQKVKETRERQDDDEKWYRIERNFRACNHYHFLV